MPELAEVKIMGDFINYIVTNEGFFDKIEKSPESKVKTELNAFNGAVFTLRAVTRGKEMILHLELIGGDINGAVTKNMNVTLGMSGSWAYVRKDSVNLEKILKHSHLRFISTKGNYLVLHDIRRFAKWKWGETWNKGRGPCPLTQYNEFVNHVKLHFQKHKAFAAPINELLMNQSFFNGIGNYLRAEILYRLDINPFQIAKELDIETLDRLLNMCHLCCRDAYALGGGKMKEWFNPYGTAANSMNDWMLCYSQKSSVVDKTGRRFWYDPKWEAFKPDVYTQK